MPDLFSEASGREPVAQYEKVSSVSEAASKPRIVLPQKLPEAIRHLDDREFERLYAAVIAEHESRGGKAPTVEPPARKAQAETVKVSLPTGKLNAIRAAFRAGVKPTQIARQFGISQIRRAKGARR